MGSLAKTRTLFIVWLTLSILPGWYTTAVAATGDPVLYPGPTGAPRSSYHTVQIRKEGGTWQTVFPNLIKVNPYLGLYATFAYFDADFTSRIEVKITSNGPWAVSTVRVRPRSYNIACTLDSVAKTATFFLDRPCNISVEFNKDLNHNLHLFANPLEVNPPQQGAAGVKYYGPGVTTVNANLGLSSNQTIYIAGGALVRGNISVSNASNITIRGRGILDASGFTSNTRLITLTNCSNVTIEGIILTNAAQWQIVPTSSDHVTITNVKEIANAVYSDGVDIVSSQNVTLDGMFIRAADDCISIKASGSEQNADILIKNCVLWSDLAHGILIGPEANGGTTQRVTFQNNDILEDYSTECGYSCGALSICSGGGQTIRDITFQDVRVDTLTMSNLINLFVEQNQFVSSPGKGIRNVKFKNITFNGDNASCANRILGYDATRTIDSVTFENLNINGQVITSAAQGNFTVNSYAAHIVFKAGTTEITGPAMEQRPGTAAQPYLVNPVLNVQNLVASGGQLYDLNGRLLQPAKIRQSGVYLFVPAAGAPAQKITVVK